MPAAKARCISLCFVERPILEDKRHLFSAFPIPGEILLLLKHIKHD